MPARPFALATVRSVHSLNRRSGMRSRLCLHIAATVVVLPLVSAGEAVAQNRGLPRVEVAAGGGFVGVRVAEVASRPAVDCDAAGVCTPVDGFVDVQDNSRTVWRPALATGLVLRWSMEPNQKDENKKFGLGIGGQMVFTPQGDGTRLLPAVTLHAGTRNTQLFFGLLFGSTDRVRFPGSGSGARVADGLTPSFIEPNARHNPNFFVGVVIDGAAVTHKSNPDTENAPEPKEPDEDTTR
jgi:hypothetical protein